MGGEQSEEGGRRKTARIGGLVVKIRNLKDLKRSQILLKDNKINYTVSLLNVSGTTQLHCYFEDPALFLDRVANSNYTPTFSDV